MSCSSSGALGLLALTPVPEHGFLSGVMWGLRQLAATDGAAALSPAAPPMVEMTFGVAVTALFFATRTISRPLETPCDAFKQDSLREALVRCGHSSGLCHKAVTTDGDCAPVTGGDNSLHMNCLNFTADNQGWRCAGDASNPLPSAKNTTLLWLTGEGRRCAGDADARAGSRGCAALRPTARASPALAR